MAPDQPAGGWRVVTWNSATDREFATRQEALDYITMNDDTGHWHVEPINDNPITMFMCGPSKCDHDYSGEAEMRDEQGRVIGGAAVCVKCGAWAFSEDMWS